MENKEVIEFLEKRISLCKKQALKLNHNDFISKAYNEGEIEAYKHALIYIKTINDSDLLYKSLIFE